MPLAACLRSPLPCTWSTRSSNQSVSKEPHDSERLASDCILSAGDSRAYQAIGNLSLPRVRRREEAFRAHSRRGRARSLAPVRNQAATGGAELEGVHGGVAHVQRARRAGDLFHPAPAARPALQSRKARSTD